jgi:hypothetical protein
MPLILKKIALSCASVFLLYQSINFLPLFTQISNTTHLGATLLIAGGINLFITGIFAFAGFAWPTENLMPRSYYLVTRKAALKKYCKALGIDYFRQFLLMTFWRDKNQQKRYFDGSKKGLTILARNARKSEFGHLLPFCLITALCAYLASLQLWWLIVFTTVINIFFNLYPILLQRQHRMRIDIMCKRLTTKTVR